MRDPAAVERRPAALMQLASFLVIGIIAALLYVGLSMLMIGLRTGIPDWIVSVACYALFIVPVYLAHRHYSFRSDVPHAIALPRYVAVQVSALCLAALFSYVCYQWLGMQSAVAAILVIGLTSGVNFVLLKLWAFSQGVRRRGPLALDMANQLTTVLHSGIFKRRVKVLAGHLADSIPSRGSVLDVGTGDGSLATLLMGLRPDLRIEGVDVMPRPEMHIPVTIYDGKTLPFTDKSFDYVTIVDVLHHTDDPASVLTEAARVARVGVVLKDHLREGLLAGPTLRFMDWVGNWGHGVRLPYNYYSRDQWQGAFYKARLTTLTNKERLGLYAAPFSWFFERKLHFVALLAPRERLA
jgi:SAM-dependent methyltransferase